ncbi:hypothetical protein CDEST_09761 [Colletotrichum destructivum]|uniref:Uncharacterized protein n=1 Tax=Colletotrichum destructivum TaxID=34406 RepID=A0AAX4IN00_9PEZI|nr:hypothetical protein CDEST_09761 [Colletotrichum destructivum]
MKSYIQIFAFVAPLLALAAPIPVDTQATTDADAESFFIQTDVGWFDGGDSKKREVAKEADAEAESFFIQTDVGWFDGGDSKKREAAKKPEAS